MLVFFGGLLEGTAALLGDSTAAETALFISVLLSETQVGY